MKAGDYVRFKTLSREIKIGKVIEIIEPDNEEYGVKKACVYDLDNNEVTVDDYIIKSSPNIIDLIEVGDYVNSLKVDEIDEKGIYNYNSYDGWRINIASCNEEIKSIVTSEQFSQMEYRIGE